MWKSGRYAIEMPDTLRFAVGTEVFCLFGDNVWEKVCTPLEAASSSLKRQNPARYMVKLLSSRCHFTMSCHAQGVVKEQYWQCLGTSVIHPYQVHVAGKLVMGFTSFRKDILSDDSSAWQVRLLNGQLISAPQDSDFRIRATLPTTESDPPNAMVFCAT